MKSSYYKRYEDKILNAVNDCIILKLKLLKEKNIYIKGPKIRILVKEKNNYTSELEVSFWKDHNPENIIEFFIFFEGKENVAKIEVEKHIKEELNKLA